MGYRAMFADALLDPFSEGEDALFCPVLGAPVPCKIFIEFNVKLQPMGLESQVWGRGTTIEALLSDAPGIGIGTVEPNRNDTFLWNGQTFKVQSILDNDDDFTVKMVVT